MYVYDCVASALSYATNICASENQPSLSVACVLLLILVVSRVRLIL